MKLKINETVEREIEVEFPLFTTDGYNFFKFINESEAIKVRTLFADISYEVQRYYKTFPHQWMLLPKITEEQFISEYKKAVELINDECNRSSGLK